MTDREMKFSNNYEEFYPKNYQRKSNSKKNEKEKEKEEIKSSSKNKNKNVSFKEYYPKNKVPNQQIHPLEKATQSFYPKQKSKFSKKEENLEKSPIIDDEEDDYSGLAGNNYYYKNNKFQKWKNKNKHSEDKNDFKSKWKTEICHYWEMYGYCKYGDSCAFAHGNDELNKRKMSNNYKTKPCKQFFELGYCSYGTRCQFSHKLLKECEEKKDEENNEVSYLKILSDFNNSSNQISHEIIKRPRLMTFESIASCTLDEKEKNRLELYEDILAVKKKENEEPEHVFSDDTNDENSENNGINENKDNKNNDKENNENNERKNNNNYDDNNRKKGKKRPRFISI